jgi:hypothetical protein
MDMSGQYHIAAILLEGKETSRTNWAKWLDRPVGGGNLKQTKHVARVDGGWEWYAAI